MEYWAEENGIELEDDGGLKYNYTTLDGLKFQEDFKIPFAGYRYYNDAKVQGIGVNAYLWSSSPGGEYNARNFYLEPSKARTRNTYSRGFARSLRCFKDSALGSSSSTIVVDSVAPTAQVEYQYFVSGTLATLT